MSDKLSDEQLLKTWECANGAHPDWGIFGRMVIDYGRAVLAAASPAPATPAVDEVDIIEQCAVCAAIHSQYPIENDFDRGYDKARKDAARSIRALKAAQAIPPCHCDMRTKALGDGCEVCQPENAPAPRSIRTPMPYIVPGSVRVCVVSDAECSRGCGDGPCKRI
ncbi:hypothetical protein [Burkholderia glumae]|uniref:hypothetical protein n=1 Tax=Burkholderia glumae TaxID=337 RepID=UPI0021514032|nr:hypothetical protein [Burkholderia glumae]